MKAGHKPVLMQNFTQDSKGILHHNNGLYKIRTRKGRNLEVCFSAKPGNWQSTGTTVLEDAEKWCDRYLLNNGHVKPSETITLEKYAKDFFSRTDEDSIRMKDVRFNKIYEDTYYIANQSRLDRYILPRFGRYAITGITDVEIENWYTSIKLKNESDRDASDSTKIKILDTFNVVLERARKQGIIKKNPLDTVERITPKNNSRVPFTQEEIASLFPEDYSDMLRVWGSLQWAVYFSIMVDTGFRGGEVAALDRSCFINGGVFTKQSVDFRTRKIKQSIKTTKKGQKYKVGILSDYTQRILSIYLDQLPDLEDFLFKSENNKFIIPDTANKHLEGVFARMGMDIKGRSQHCFRHAFDTYMLSGQGGEVNAKDVQELMAHTGYRPEYDHRTPQQIIFRLNKVKPVINNLRKIQ